MYEIAVSPPKSFTADERAVSTSTSVQDKTWRRASAQLAASITQEASLQTYLTIRYLADPGLADDAYRAYAYFRWVDDMLDESLVDLESRLVFLARQQALIAQCYRGQTQDDLCLEEQMAADLIAGDRTSPDWTGISGLRTYIEQMMAVMAFDAKRKGHVVSGEERDTYTHALAVAVTEAMHYFIGHGQYAPRDATRYAAVTGAHLAHMLRDAIEDAEAGYFNLPAEYLDAHQLGPAEVNHQAYRAWVADQVALARRCFTTGREYMAQVENLRCRLAGYAYIARFECVLDAIEQENFLLREAYPERKSAKSRLKMLWAAISQTAASMVHGQREEVGNFKPAVEVAK